MEIVLKISEISRSDRINEWYSSHNLYLYFVETYKKLEKNIRCIAADIIYCFSDSGLYVGIYIAFRYRFITIDIKFFFGKVKLLIFGIKNRHMHQLILEQDEIYLIFIYFELGISLV